MDNNSNPNTTTDMDNITEAVDILDKYCRDRKYQRPKYRIEFISDDVYKKVYTVSCEVKGMVKVADSGISRRIAEKKAAIRAMSALRYNGMRSQSVMPTPQVAVRNVKPNGQLVTTGAAIEIKSSIDNSNNSVRKVTAKLLNNGSTTTDGQKLRSRSEPKLNKLSMDVNDIQFIDDNNRSIAGGGGGNGSSGSGSTTAATSAAAANHYHLRNNNSNITNAYDIQNPGNGFQRQSPTTTNSRYRHKSYESLSRGTGDNHQELANNNNHNNNDNYVDISSIHALIQYCIRRRQALPFYDFSYIDGQFVTQCRVELAVGDDKQLQEFMAYGSAQTLKAAKAIASQKIIDEIKQLGLYSADYPDNRQDVRHNSGAEFVGRSGFVVTTNKSGADLLSHQSSSSSRQQSPLKEFSSLTINLRSRPVNDDNREKKFNTLPKLTTKSAKMYATDDDYYDDNNGEHRVFNESTGCSTLDSRDDNNNPSNNNNNYNLIIDDPVGYLSRYCSKNKLKSPDYQRNKSTATSVPSMLMSTIKNNKKDNCPLFTYDCIVCQKTGRKVATGRGLGNTKVNARKAAAEDVVKQLLNIKI